MAAAKAVNVTVPPPSAPPYYTGPLLQTAPSYSNSGTLQPVTIVIGVRPAAPGTHAQIHTDRKDRTYLCAVQTCSSAVLCIPSCARDHHPLWKRMCAVPAACMASRMTAEAGQQGLNPLGKDSETGAWVPNAQC